MCVYPFVCLSVCVHSCCLYSKLHKSDRFLCMSKSPSEVRKPGTNNNLYESVWELCYCTHQYVHVENMLSLCVHLSYGIYCIRHFNCIAMVCFALLGIGNKTEQKKAELRRTGTTKIIHICYIFFFIQMSSKNCLVKNWVFCDVVLRVKRVFAAK